MNMLLKKTTLAALTAGVLLTGCGKISPDEKADKGLLLLANQDYRGAEIALKSALSDAPELTQARIGLAKLSLRQGNYTAALNELDKAAQYAIRDEAVMVAMLRAYAYNMSDNVAVLGLEDHNNPMILYYQYIEQLKGNKPEEAALTFERLEQFSGGFSALASIANRASVEPTGELLILLDDLSGMSHEPSVPVMNDAGTGALEDARLDLGIQIASDLQSIDRLTALLEDYHTRHPGDSTRRLEYADMLIMNGEHEKAREVIQPLLDMYPENGLLNRMRAVIAFESKDYAIVDSAGLLAAASNPSDPLPRLLMAYSDYAQNDLNGAMENLDLVIDDLPESHPAQRLYLQLDAMSGDLADAADRSLMLKDLTQDDATMLTSIGMALLRQGDEARAKRIAERVEEIRPQGESAASLGMLQLSLDDERAMETLENAFRTDPSSLIAGQTFAAALLNQRNFTDALALAKQWQTGDKIAEGFLLEATVHTLTEEPVEAMSAYSKAYDVAPESPRVAAGYMSALIADGDDEQALSVLNDALSRDQDALYRFFVGAYRDRDGKRGVGYASDKLAQLINASSLSSPGLMLSLAQSYFVAEQPQKAYEWVQKISSDARPPAYFLLKSTIEQQLERSDAALVTLKAWQEASPSNPMPLMGRVRMYIQSGDLEEALGALDVFISQSDQATPASLIRGHVLAMMRRWDSVYDAYINLNSQQQQSPLGKALYGIHLVRQGEYTQAVNALESLLTTTMDNVYLPFYVTALENSGNAEKAGEFLVKATALSPENRYAWFLLANNAAMREDFARADKAFAQILEDSTPSVVLNNYAYVKLKLGDVGDALALSKRAVKLSPNTPAFVETLASIYLEKGDARAAYEIMKPIIDSGVEVNDQFRETFAASKQ